MRAKSVDMCIKNGKIVIVTYQYNERSTTMGIMSEEHKEKLRIANSTRKRSEAERKKQSDAMKRRWAKIRELIAVAEQKGGAN